MDEWPEVFRIENEHVHLVIRAPGPILIDELDIDGEPLSVK